MSSLESRAGSSQIQATSAAASVKSPVSVLGNGSRTIDSSTSSSSADSGSTSPLSSQSPISHETAITATSVLQRTMSIPTPTLFIVTATTTAVAGHKSVETLPLIPKITPALSIAGVILLVTGLFYTLVGIKSRILHISLSAAYLTSLAVSVIIVYVMNPPISNARQVAYLVAAIITGAIFGSLSLIFTEVTEGLGCLLGGVSLAMWFLVLTPGGLIPSAAGKIGFIAAFAIAVFALAFYHRTRPYGMMGSTSFAGATVIVLGIDCFSRAGLKEFWLYVWNLNSNLFPVGTTTYPHTRGIRVEIAAIMLIASLGVLSQMRLWKVIKARRDEKAAERQKQERDLNKLEENVGRKIQQETGRERVEWEAVYGDAELAQTPSPDIGPVEDVDNTHKDSLNLEFSGPSDSRQTSCANLSATRHGQDLDRRVPDPSGATEVKKLVSEADRISSLACSSTRLSGADLIDPSRTPGNTLASNLPCQTDRVDLTTLALPFNTTPVERHDDEDKQVSVEASNGNEEIERLRQLSTMSALRRMSAVASRGSRHSRGPGGSHSSLGAPHFEDDDDASSLEATRDDLTESRISILSDHDIPIGDLRDHGSVLPQSSMFITGDVWPSTLMPVLATDAELHAGLDLRKQSAVSVSASPEPAISGSPAVASRELVDRTLPIPNALMRSQDDRSSETKVEDEGILCAELVAKSTAESRNSEEQSLSVETLQPRKRVSKIVMSYRTNEWAKHIGAAEKPVVDDLRLEKPDEGHLSGEGDFAIPVDVKMLQQTAEGAVPMTDVRNTPRIMMNTHTTYGSGKLSRLAANDSSVSLQTHLIPPATKCPPRQLSRPSPHHSSSPSSPSSPQSESPTQIAMMRSAIPTTSRDLHNSPPPLQAQPLLDSPGEEDSIVYPLPSRLTPSPMPKMTLIGKRDILLRNKFSTASLGVLNTAPADLGPKDSFSAHGFYPATCDEDELTLSERRALLHQRRRQSDQSRVVPNSRIPFDSHQPQRRRDEVDRHRRESMLAEWRQSIQNDLHAGQDIDIIAADAQRAKMLQERQIQRLSVQQAMLTTKYRHSALDETLRQGDLLTLHREAMRRMQADANKHV